MPVVKSSELNIDIVQSEVRDCVGVSLDKFKELCAECDTKKVGEIVKYKNLTIIKDEVTV